MLIKHQKGESYQHAAARTVFKHWLDLSKGNFGPFKWRDDTGHVWEECPFVKSIDIQWDWYWNYENSPKIKLENYPIPTYEELLSLGLVPIAIADIAIQHKGSICDIIEIVHKNDLSEEKINKLLNLIKSHKATIWGDMNIWRVEAHWILAQIGLPNSFPEECIRRVG